jgi:hypothetical protein
VVGVGQCRVQPAPQLGERARGRRAHRPEVALGGHEDATDAQRACHPFHRFDLLPAQVVEQQPAMDEIERVLLDLVGHEVRSASLDAGVVAEPAGVEVDGDHSALGADAGSGATAQRNRLRLRPRDTSSPPRRQLR